MTVEWDILGLGCVGIDELLYVSHFPEPDSKLQIDRSEQHGGGQTGTALVAAARLGSRCAYAGALGHDPVSATVRAGLEAEGIDCAHVVYRDDARPVQAWVIVDGGQKTRTILYDLTYHVGADENGPAEATIRAAKILFIDQHGIHGNIRASQIARAAGIPIVADFEHDRFDGFDRLLPLVDHLIISDTFAAYLTGAGHPGDAARQLWTDDRALVAVTCGADGSWYYTGSGEPQHQVAFPVDVVDTTGCGDVFHGAYAAAMARGAGVTERIEFAAAAAALKARLPGGRAGIPDRAETEAYIQQYSTRAR